ncbi:MAG: ATP-dependent sacrificial sulfur transferase LarE [Candidatus Omnitrophica bacterium]|nr:ATP-dependent sacrificial sulfur transferase LarE [Candidatus Omnitrophota bacterium]
MNKLRKLKKILQAMDSVLVAYSGGIDSTFLLKIAHEVLKDKVLAVTANSPTYPPEELTFSKRMARILGARHKIIQTQELQDARFIANPVNRCYFCKKELFSRLKDIARKNRLNFVADASNLSDKKDFRPGNKAKEELGVCSPLEQAGFTKDDIRRLSNKLGLKTWNKPSLACLASRIPYGTKITPHLLERIDKAENVLRRMGLNQVRLRHYNGLCRIEVMKKDILALIRKGDLIVERFKKMGYNYVTLDLEGYRTGSLNEVIKK